jgi:hypothetical protein
MKISVVCYHCESTISFDRIDIKEFIIKDKVGNLMFVKLKCPICEKESDLV